MCKERWRGGCCRVCGCVLRVWVMYAIVCCGCSEVWCIPQDGVGPGMHGYMLVAYRVRWCRCAVVRWTGTGERTCVLNLSLSCSFRGVRTRAQLFVGVV